MFKISEQLRNKILQYISNSRSDFVVSEIAALMNELNSLVNDEAKPQEIKQDKKDSK